MNMLQCETCLAVKAANYDFEMCNLFFRWKLHSATSQECKIKQRCKGNNRNVNVQTIWKKRKEMLQVQASYASESQQGMITRHFKREFVEMHHFVIFVEIPTSVKFLALKYVIEILSLHFLKNA